MPEGMFRAAPISTEIHVGSIPMLLQIWKRCMPQLLRRKPEIIHEIGLHTEQCKSAAAWRAINRLTDRKFK